MEVDKHPPNSSQSFSGTAEDSMDTSIGRTTTAPALSPEKSLFGNSADKLRESNLESIVSNGNTSSNGKETFEETNGEEEEMEVDISKNNEEEEDNKDDSLENKAEILLNDKKSDDKPKLDNKNWIKMGPPTPKNDKEEDIEDKANEEVCIRREVTPLTDKEAAEVVEDAAKEFEKDVTPEAIEMDAKDDDEDKAAETPAEDIPEPEAPSTRRSTRRSNAATTPAAKPIATPKATPKNAKKSKATPIAKKEDSAAEEDNKEGEKEDETGEAEEADKDESQAETPSTRRNLRTPKSTTKEVTTPASSRAKKSEAKEEEAPAVEEPTTGNRRRSTRTAVVKKEEEAKTTPTKAVKKELAASAKNTRKRGAPKEEKAKDEKEEEVSESETKTPIAKRAKKEDAAEETETKPTPRRTSSRAKATTPAAAKTPAKTPKGKATPKQIKQESEAEDVEMESEEEAEVEEEENPTKAGQKTPKRAPPKRGAATGKRPTKPTTRKRNASEPTDPNDPFNFDAKKDEHPELFKSVHVERQSFGTIKFFKSSNAGSASKYASMEKNATERKSLNPEVSPTSAAASAANTPGSSKTRTPASTKKSPVRRGRINLKGKSESENAPEAVDFEDEGDEKEVSEEPKKPKTPKSDAVSKPPKIQEEAPKLTAEEQIAADDESNAHFPKGARVYAIWGKEYYSAICDDSDGLGRYKVFYTEDQSIRNIPRGGIIPLYMVKEGSDVSVLGEKDEDGERVIYEGKVLAIPSIKETDEWHRGLYKLEVHNEEHPEPESREIEWFDIYFTEPQYKQIIKTIKNPTVVDAENVIESGRRTRRSTAAATTTTTPSSITPSATTPKPRGKPGPKPKGTPKAAAATPKTAKVEKAKEASPEHEAAEAATKEEGGSGSEGSKDTSKFFDKLQFILTSANRQTGPPPFTKKDVRKQIESRGGNVVETFESMNPDLTTYLIADTFYRTHKYLTALSLSVPTVSFKWINKCVEENKLVDYNDFMLDAGESETTGEVYKWKPLKGKILVGKKVAVYSKRGAPPTNNGIDFCQIWGPIVVNLGAELVNGYPSETEKAVEFFKNKNTTDYFIADDGTPQELINAVTEGSGIPVTSEWIIQTIITGILATTAGNESYILQPK